MPEIVMKDGKLAGKADYEQSDIVQQMLNEATETAKAEALKDVPTKESVIQGLKAEELGELEPVKQMLTEAETKAKEEAEKANSKEAVVQALTKDEVKALKPTEEIVEEALKQANFFAKLHGAVGADGKPVITDGEGGEKSFTRRMMEESSRIRI